MHTYTKMQSIDLAVQLEQEQHNNNKLQKRLWKANEKRAKHKQQRETARKYIKSLEERLNTDRHLETINELWQQLQAARAEAEHLQAKQELQDAQTDSVLAETGAQVKLVKRQLAAAKRKQGDLQKELKTAQQQSVKVSANLQATQQQLASATAARDALSKRLTAAEQQGREWRNQRDQAHRQALEQAGRVINHTSENLALIEAAEKADADRGHIIQQATAGLTANLAFSHAELAELRRDSAATISKLQSQLLDAQKIGALCTTRRKPELDEKMSLQGSKPSAAAEPPAPKVAGKSAAQQRSTGRAVTDSGTAAGTKGAPARRKQPSRTTKLVSFA